MATDFEAAFQALREVLRAQGAGLAVAADSPTRFCLEAAPGPATLAAWGGRARRPTLPVAWVERGKSYVSYHLMGLDGTPGLVAALSPGLQARKQGKTCFNFQRPEPELLEELGAVTAASITGLLRAGYAISTGPAA
ncbi:MAG: hypothetical protein ACJ76D_05090 [Solirubrobacterales bacterium]